MSNLTSSLASFSDESSDDKIKAQKFFNKKYIGIIYDFTTDSYEYRGYKFDYFKCGLGVNPVNLSFNNQDSYMLVDKNNAQLWLFTYGDSEERWNDYKMRTGRPQNSFWG